MKLTRVLLLFIFLVFTGSVACLWWKDAVAPSDPSNSTPVVFTIARGEGARSVATRLASEKLVRSSTGFFLLVKFIGIERNLQVGDFRLNRTMDAAAVAQTLTHGTLDVWVTTLEGWRVEEIATKLAKSLDIPEMQFLKDSREGYMFPDTYLIPKDATAGAIVKIFSDNFQKKTFELQSVAAKTGLTFDDVVILASIVEREGRTDEDRPIIAGILINRLKAGWPLQTDATLQYALGYQPSEKSWWKKSLFDEDKTINSPYNTYRNPGLPPGPIANPGMSALKAVVYFQKTDYWYYLHDPTGQVHYAKTIQEHAANISKYLQ